MSQQYGSKCKCHSIYIVFYSTSEYTTFYLKLFIVRGQKQITMRHLTIFFLIFFFFKSNINFVESVKLSFSTFKVTHFLPKHLTSRTMQVRHQWIQINNFSLKRFSNLNPTSFNLVSFSTWRRSSRPISKSKIKKNEFSSRIRSYSFILPIAMSLNST